MTKELIKIEQELQQILGEGQLKEAEYIEEVKTARTNEEEANRAVIEAKKGDDPKAYAKAIEDKRMASNIAEYYEGKIEELKAEPFITEEEYKDYTKRIKAEMDAINNKGKAKASKLFKELETIKEEVTPSYNKANELLGELQNNIYKHSYEKVMNEARENKTPLNTSTLHNEYKDNSLLTAIDFILNQNVTQNIKDGGGK